VFEVLNGQSRRHGRHQGACQRYVSLTHCAVGLRGSRFHSIFHLSEDHSRETFTSEIEFHVLELPKLRLAGTDRQAKLDRWARFLRAQTAEELENLACEDAIMTTAKDALHELSSDPTAQRLARERETAVLMHRHLINSSLEHGREEGLRVAAHAVRALCDVLGVEMDTVREERLLALNCDELAELVQHLKTERRWPEGYYR
jgi:predicted transposase/invertase (TIGR01784 family)